jgi:hypothetical protein
MFQSSKSGNPRHILKNFNNNTTYEKIRWIFLKNHWWSCVGYYEGVIIFKHIWKHMDEVIWFMKGPTIDFSIM